jgi:serine protease Do
MKAKPNKIKLLMISLFTASIIGGFYWHSKHSLISEAGAITNITSQTPINTQRTMVTLPNFSSIVANNGASVVNISVTGTVRNETLNTLPQMDPDDPFFEFFKHFQPNLPEAESPISGMGSGFIVKSNGVILTNAHVVDNADEVTVKLTDKREFKAKVLGVDKPTDVAVLKIEAENLPAVKIGTTQTTNVGDWVLAIGSPFGLENTVTAGIVSAKSRALPDEGYVPFLQTDVAINPGNSGGPLFNLNGEVIGINSQIYSRSGGYQGLSFSIPIEVAMKTEQQLLEHGTVSRGRIGVGIQSLNQNLANSFGLDKPIGALVGSVEKNGPADKAGIEPGDVITKFNGKTVNLSSDLPSLVAEVRPKETVSVEIWHKNHKNVLMVKVDEMKETNISTQLADKDNGKLSLNVRPLTEDEKIQAHVGHGLLVESVSKGPAEKAGIHSGDVILAVNGDEVKSIEDLTTQVNKTKKTLALLIARGEYKLYIPINLG